MRLLFFIFIFLMAIGVQATTFPLPANPKDSLVGDPPHKIKYAIANYEDTLLDIARRYDLGQNQILLANPDVDRWLPGDGTRVRIPNSYILPDAPRDGVILNLPEFRLYYFPKPAKGERGVVETHPISIGRQDWDTPLGKTRILSKKRNPVWIPPASIKKEHAEKGDPLPDVVPAGPDNPLGLYAMRLAIPGYLIHSTNKPYGVGMRVSHGCVRMYPEDIEKLFPMIKVGTPVYIVNQPIKVGWLEDTLYIEVHPPLEGHLEDYQAKLDHALDLIEKANDGVLPVVRGSALKKALREANGIPVAIFERPIKSDELDVFDEK